MLVYLRLLLTTMFWGGTMVAGRDLAQHIGPYSASFLRFVVASTCLWFIIRKREGGLPPVRGRQWIALVLLGMTGVFAYNIFFLQGLALIPAGRTAIIIALNPVVITIFSAILFKERLTLLQTAGILISVTGASIAISHGNPLELFRGGLTKGDFFIMGCVASWSSYSLIGKQAMRTVSPHAAVTFSSVIGCLALLPCALADGLLRDLPTLPAVAWLDVGYLGIFGTVVGFTWYYQGLKQVGAAKASVFINFVPIFAIFQAHFILGEPIHVSQLFGAVTVGFGVWLSNRGKAMAKA